MWFLHSYYITGEIGEPYFLWWYRCHIYILIIIIYILACFSLGLKHSLWCDRQYLFNDTLQKIETLQLKITLKSMEGFHGVSSNYKYYKWWIFCHGWSSRRVLIRYIHMVTQSALQIQVTNDSAFFFRTRQVWTNCWEIPSGKLT